MIVLKKSYSCERRQLRRVKPNAVATRKTHSAKSYTTHDICFGLEVTGRQSFRPNPCSASLQQLSELVDPAASFPSGTINPLVVMLALVNEQVRQQWVDTRLTRITSPTMGLIPKELVKTNELSFRLTIPLTNFPLASNLRNFVLLVRLFYNIISVFSHTPESNSKYILL